MAQTIPAQKPQRKEESGHYVVHKPIILKTFVISHHSIFAQEGVLEAVAQIPGDTPVDSRLDPASIPDPG